MSDFERDAFFDSDLSELTDDEDDEPIAPSRKPGSSGAHRAPSPARGNKKALKSTQDKTYTVKDVLRVPRSAQYTVRSLYDQLNDETINLNPDYQRDVVWTDAKQTGLIDSIFRNYYIPPVVFAVTTLDDGTESRVCIDGKQRLTSIQRFLDGTIPHRDFRTGKKYYYKKTSARRAATSVISKAMQQQFANKQIHCMEYSDITEDQEREIFQRVQLGVALTPSERMQAISNPRANFIRQMMDHVLGKDGFGESLEWGRARGRDFQGLASIVCLIDMWPAHKAPVSTNLETWLSKPDEIPEKRRNEIAHTLQIFLHLTRSKHFNLPFHKPSRVAPIEFVFIGVLIHRYRQQLSLMQLSSAIEKMRKDVREEEKDIRTNTRCVKILSTFVDTTLPKQLKNLVGDGKGDKPAAKVIAVPKLKQVAAAVAASKKRKRSANDGDESSSDSSASDSSEDEPLRRKRSSAPSKKPVLAPSLNKAQANTSQRSSSSVKPSKSSSVAAKSRISPLIPGKAPMQNEAPPLFAASGKPKPASINTTGKGLSTTSSTLKQNHPSTQGPGAPSPLVKREREVTSESTRQQKSTSPTQTPPITPVSESTSLPAQLSSAPPAVGLPPSGLPQPGIFPFQQQQGGIDLNQLLLAMQLFGYPINPSIFAQPGLTQPNVSFPALLSQGTESSGVSPYTSSGPWGLMSSTGMNMASLQPGTMPFNPSTNLFPNGMAPGQSFGTAPQGQVPPNAPQSQGTFGIPQSQFPPQAMSGEQGSIPPLPPSMLPPPNVPRKSSVPSASLPPMVQAPVIPVVDPPTSSSGDPVPASRTPSASPMSVKAAISRTSSSLIDSAPTREQPPTTPTAAAPLPRSSSIPPSSPVSDNTPRQQQSQQSETKPLISVSLPSAAQLRSTAPPPFLGNSPPLVPPSNEPSGLPPLAGQTEPTITSPKLSDGAPPPVFSPPPLPPDAAVPANLSRSPPAFTHPPPAQRTPVLSSPHWGARPPPSMPASMLAATYNGAPGAQFPEIAAKSPDPLASSSGAMNVNHPLPRRPSEVDGQLSPSLSRLPKLDSATSRQTVSDILPTSPTSLRVSDDTRPPGPSRSYDERDWRTRGGTYDRGRDPRDRSYDRGMPSSGRRYRDDRSRSPPPRGGRGDPGWRSGDRRSGDYPNPRRSFDYSSK